MTSTPPACKYGDFQKEGSRIQKEISDPNVPTKIPTSELTYEQLEAQGYAICHKGESQVDSRYLDSIEQVGLMREVEHYYKFDIDWPTTGTEFTWIGYISKGIIILEDIRRGIGHPHISEVSKAVYKHKFDIEHLRHIFVSDILQPETAQFVGSKLYNENDPPYFYGDHPGVQNWEYDTDEYQALLGTPIGKIVSSLILAEFNRGTRRITRVTTWIDWSALQMRFDIEIVNS